MPLRFRTGVAFALLFAAPTSTLVVVLLTVLLTAVTAVAE